MNDLQIIEQWLRNPDRKFSDGINLRNKYKANNRMDGFFSKANPDSPSSIEVNMLLQEVSKIHIKLIHNPKILESRAAQSIISNQPISTSETPKTTRIKIESKKLKAEDLPDELKPVFSRIQEIAPILGAEHAKLKATQSDEDSKELASAVLKLDQEKRELWKQIDAYFSGQGKKLVVTDDDNNNQQPLSPYDKIMSIADPKEKRIAIEKRIKIVSDDIVKAKNKLEEFVKSKPHLVDQKKESIAQKEAELKKLNDACDSIKRDK